MRSQESKYTALLTSAAFVLMIAGAILPECGGEAFPALGSAMSIVDIIVGLCTPQKCEGVTKAWSSVRSREVLLHLVSLVRG